MEPNEIINRELKTNQQIAIRIVKVKNSRIYASILNFITWTNTNN